MRRREFLSLLSSAATWPIGLRAQQPAKIHQLGYLGVTTLSAHIALGFIPALRRGLREHGYDEGRNIEFRWMFAEGKYERLAGLAAALAKSNVDIVLTHSTPGALAAKGNIAAIPVVVIVAADLVASGVAASLARPGGNITGQNILSAEIGAKRIELIKEAVPASKRIAILLNRGNEYSARALRGMQGVGQALGLQLLVFDLRSSNDFAPALAALAQASLDAIVTIEDPVLIANAAQVVGLAANLALPLIGGPEFDVKAGMLMAYGVNLRELWFRSAAFVDKILRGAKPADLPIEQATNFELIINLKRARALGLALPPALIARADEVIE